MSAAVRHHSTIIAHINCSPHARWFYEPTAKRLLLVFLIEPIAVNPATTSELIESLCLCTDLGSNKTSHKSVCCGIAACFGSVSESERELELAPLASFEPRQ